MIATTERGRIAIAPDAIAQIVGAAAAESYGVVALAGRGRFSRLCHGGSRRESTSTCGRRGSRSSFASSSSTGSSWPRSPRRCGRASQYELERMVGLPIASLEVHIEGVGRADGARSRPPPRAKRAPEPRGASAAHRRPERLSGPRRRHGHEPRSHAALDRRGARRVDGGRQRGGREGRHASGAHGSARQLGRHLLPDRPWVRGGARSTRGCRARHF